MRNYSARLVYPKQEFQIVLQHSTSSNDFYAVDEMERKKLKIIKAKYGCNHYFHNVPDHVTLDLNRFYWNSNKACYEIDAFNKTVIQLNKLEESIIDYMPDLSFQY